jgi:hypothetical protein
MLALVFLMAPLTAAAQEPGQTTNNFLDYHSPARSGD